MPREITCVPSFKGIQGKIVGQVRMNKGMAPQELYLHLLKSNIPILGSNTEIQEELINIANKNFDSNLGTILLGIGTKVLDIYKLLRDRDPSLDISNLPNTVESIMGLWSDIAKEVRTDIASTPMSVAAVQVPIDVVAEETPSSDEVESEPEKYMDLFSDQDRIVKPTNSRYIDEIWDYYLVGNLTTHVDTTVELFKDIVAKVWLDPFNDKPVLETEDITSNIKKALTKVIKNYYVNNSYEIISVKDTSGTISTDINNVLIFKDINSIPDSKPLYSTANEVTFYTNGSIVGNDGLPLLLAVGEDVGYEDIQEVLENSIADGTEEEPPLVFEDSVIDGGDNGMPRIDRNTVQEYEGSREMLGAYFAQMMLNELDTFIDTYLPVLNSTYKEKVRTGYGDIQIFGSDMANKLTKLNIETTPFLYRTNEIDNINNVIKSITDKVMHGDSIVTAIVNSGLLQAFSLEDNKVIQFKLKNKQYTGILVNLGKNNILMVNDGNSWSVLPAGLDEPITIANFIEQAETLHGKLEQGYVGSLYKLNTLLTSRLNNSSIIVELGQQAGIVPMSMLDVLELANTTQPGTLENAQIPKFIVGSGSKKYLTSAQLEVAATLLQTLPNTLDGAIKALSEMMNRKDTQHSDIARALYYKFFAPESYTVTEYNPMTGLLETNVKSSVLAAFKSNEVLESQHAVVALASAIRSTASDDKVMLLNGNAVSSNIQKGTSLNGVLEQINYDNTRQFGNKRITNPDVYEKFNVVDLGNKKLRIEYYQFDKKAEPSVSFIVRNRGVSDIDGNPIGGFKYELVTEEDNNLMLQDIRYIGAVLGIPNFMTTDDFYSTLNTELQYINRSNFYVNLLLTKLANGEDIPGNKAYTKSGSHRINLVASGSGEIKYQFKENAFDFINAFDRTLEKVHGSSKRFKIMGPEGQALSASVITNKAKSKQSLVEQAKAAAGNPDYLYSYNAFVTGDLKFLDNGKTKNGIKKNNEGKSNSNLNELEQVHFLIEGMYLQTAEKSGFISALFQEGTMSDRSSVNVNLITYENKDLQMLPEIDGLLDEQLLRNQYKDTQRKHFDGLVKGLSAQWISYLQSHNIDIPKEYIDKDGNLTITRLAQLKKLLDGLKLDFNSVSRYSDMVSNQAYVKHPEGHVSLNNAMVQMDTVVNGNEDIYDLFINTYLNTFKRYISDLGYKISDNAAGIIKQRFDKVLNNTEAQEVLLRSFFYQDSIFEQESIQLTSGTVFQYSNAAKKVDSLFELMPKSIIGKSSEDKVKWFMTTKLLGNKKPVQKLSFDDIKAQGAKGARIGFIKSVLESSMTANQKLTLLQFDDIFSQISPMYIARVKRNQGNGTSFQNYIFADDNKAGFYLDKETAEILVDDPQEILKILGTGLHKQDTYDGVQMALPIFFYKHNNSLGNKFSNFRSRSVLKTVNVSNRPDGSYLYEKHAVFPMFNWEMVHKSTVQHSAIARVMMDTIKYNEVDPTFDGLYLDADITNPSTEYNTPLNYTDVLKHGEYLGTLQVNGELMSVVKVLSLIENGDITDNTQIFTNKTLYPHINSFYDIYLHFDGADGDLKALYNSDNKEKFVEEYPYGFVQYKIGEIITSYRGANGTYPIRNSVISKIAFSSQAKTGSTKVNPSSIITQTEFQEGEVSYSMIPNEYSGPVLMPEHEPDTTASYSMTQDDHDNLITMVTQILSASIAQGESSKEVDVMYSAVGLLSDIQLELFEDQLSQYEKEEKSLDGAYRKMAVKLAQKAIRTMQDPGNLVNFLGKDNERVDKLAFDIKQILPLVRRALNSHLNANTVKAKMKGGQYIVSNSYDQVRTYTYGNVHGLFRSNTSNYKTKTQNGSHRVGTSINELIRRDVEGGKSNRLPGEWSLDTLTSSAQLINSHILSDYIYKVTDTGYVTMKVIDVLKDNTLIQDIDTGTVQFKSPWINQKNNAINGDTLNWIDYTRNGQSIKDTDAFLSYYLAGAAPQRLADIKSKSKNNEELAESVLKYFKQELGVEGVPKLMWARYIHRSKDDVLSTIPFLTNELIDAAYTKFSIADVDSIEQFVDWIIRSSKDPQGFVKRFKPQLVALLQEDGWVTKDAEFYLPPMHQSAYLIDHGDDLNDIIGANEQPDVTTLKGMLTDDEIDLLERNFVVGGEVVDAIKEKIKNTEYYRLKSLQRESMSNYFYTKISNIEKLAVAPDANTDGIIKRAPLFLLHSTKKSKSRTLKLIDKLLTNKDILSNQEFADILIDLRSKLQLVVTNRESEKLVLEYITNFKAKWEVALSNSFPSSLTFITARIPATGKQSFVAGKVKNFIYSTRNAIYGPLEMLAITGADHDIDKQNNMTWDVDFFGRIIDWQEYLTNGKIDLNSFKGKLLKEEEAFKTRLTNAGVNVTDKQLDIFREGRLNHLSRATQNFIIHNLRKIARDPKNGIEFATAVAMNKLGVIKDYLDSFKIEKNDYEKFGLVTDTNGKLLPNEALMNAILARQYAIPFTPSTKIIYEKVNMDGKTGVGIFASSLKAYFAAYYACISSNDAINFNTNIKNKTREEILSDNLDKVQTDLQLGLHNTEAKYLEFNNPKARALGIDKKAIHFIWKDNKTGLFKIKDDIYNIANAKQHVPFDGKTYSGLKTARGKQVYRDLSFTTDIQEQKRLIDKYFDDLNFFGDITVEDQAWNDLSELINAATDNAKELILGKIGSNNTTGSLIATMVMLGIDLNIALSLVNTPTIAKVVKQIDKAKQLVDNDEDFVPAFKSLLEDMAKSYKPMLESSDEDIRKSIELEYGNKLPEAVLLKMIKEQKLLREHYNPAAQLSWFSGMADEMTKLARVLSINQGMPINELDVFNFVRALGDAIGDSNVNAFINGSENERKAIIEKYNKNKVAFNIPYILSKNKHYFSYIKSLLKSNEIISLISFTNRVLNDFIAPAMPVSKTSIQPHEYTAFVNTLMDITIDKFYKNPATNSKLELGKYGSYDLALPHKIGNVKGRQEFVEEYPDILNKLISDRKIASNVFLNRVSSGEPEKDVITGKSIRLLKGINIANTSKAQIAEFKWLLKDLKKNHSIIYDTLFNYSLIVYKGGLGKGSITSLFDSTRFEEFETFINQLEKTKTLDNLFLKLDSDVKSLLFPILRKQYSTKKGKTNFKDTSTVNQMEYIESDSIDNEYDNLNQFHEGFEGEYQDRYVDYKEIAAKDYDVSDMDKHISHAPAIWTSRTNGLTYALNNELGSYVPITKIVSNSVPGIVVNTDTKLNDTSESLQQLGYDWGWEILLPNGNIGRLLKLKNRFKGTYTILDENRKLNSLTVSEIEAYNPHIKLKYEAIKIMPGIYKARDPFKLYRNPETMEVSTEPLDGYTQITVKSAKDKVIHDSTPAIVNKKLTDKIVQNFKTKNVKSGKTFEDIISLFPEFQREMELSVIMSTRGSNNYMVAEKLLHTQDPSRDLLLLRQEFSRISDADKYSLMRSTDQALSGYLAELLDLTTPIIANVKGSSVSNLRDGKSWYNSDIEYLTTPSVVSQIETYKYVAFLNRLGITNQDYLDLIDKDILYHGHTVTLSNKVEVEKQEMKYSKKIQLPYEDRNTLLKEYSPKVIEILGSFLKKRFKNTKLRILSTADIKTLYGDHMTDASAFVYNGVIVMDKSKASLSDSLHEMGHLYLAEIKDKDIQHYERLVRLVEEYPELIQAAKEAYINENLTDVDIKEEVFVELLAKANAVKLHDQLERELEDSEGTRLGKVIKVFKSIFSDFFGNKKAADSIESLNGSLLDILDKIGTDVIFNKNSMLNKFVSKDKNKFKKLLPSYFMNESEAEDYLKELGFIKWICE